VTQTSLNIRRLAAIGAAIVVVVIAVLLAVTAARADGGGAASVSLTDARTVACETDAAGYCTVAHGLGVEPESVLLTPVLFDERPYLLGLVSRSATNLVVRAAFSSAEPMANVTVEFSYAVFANQLPPTVTSTTTRTTTTTTTTPPATTTTTPPAIPEPPATTTNPPPVTTTTTTPLTTTTTTTTPPLIGEGG
jgi:hypothetical protein